MTDKLFGATTMDPRRAHLIRETYLMLSVAVVAALAGGWIGARTMPVIEFFAGPIGWITAMVLLNVFPFVAIWASRKGPALGMAALAGNGFVSGLVLSPLLFVAMLMSGMGEDTPNLIQAALVITGSIFAAVTAYVWRCKTQFSSMRGIMFGLFVTLMVAIPMNMFLMKSGILFTAITVLIGLLGVCQLVYSTSTILNDPEFDSPTYGALALFAGLFNLFQAVLSLLVRSRD